MRAASIRLATPDDAPALATLGRATFLQTFMEDFAMGYAPEDLQDYLDRVYTPAAFAARIGDPATGVWIAEAGGDAGGEAVAYAVAGPCGLPHPDVRPQDGELKQLYLTRSLQGSGFGRVLLETTLAWLDPDRRRTVWIGVWSGNLRAQAVYARYGFHKAGEYEFPVGRVRDHEFILRRGPAGDQRV